jgi:transcriptional regulator with XRE-family HTH domain
VIIVIQQYFAAGEWTMTLASKDFPTLLNDLFQTRRKPDGEPYTASEIANWIEDNIPGAEISPSYLSRLRSGDLRNPSRAIISYLCLAFQVPPSYFFPELAHLSAAPPPDNTTMLRTALLNFGLDDESQRLIEALARKLRRAGRSGRQRRTDTHE